jgi:hypothetical protein
MSAIWGVNGSLKVGSTPTAFIQLKSWTLERTAEALNSTVVTEEDMTYLPGPRTATVSCEGFYDSADTGQAEFVHGVSVAFELEPEAGVGTKFSGDGVVTSSSQTGGAEGIVEVSFSIQVSGAVTETALP